MIEEVVAHIFTGFANIVAGLHMSAVNKPSILNIAKYLIIFFVIPLTAVIAYDHYYPIFKGLKPVSTACYLHTNSYCHSCIGICFISLFWWPLVAQLASEEDIAISRFMQIAQ